MDKANDKQFHNTSVQLIKDKGICGTGFLWIMRVVLLTVTALLVDQ